MNADSDCSSAVLISVDQRSSAAQLPFKGCRGEISGDGVPHHGSSGKRYARNPFKVTPVSGQQRATVAGHDAGN